MNAAHFYGYPVVSAGLTGSVEDCSELVESSEHSGFYRRVILRENVPVGMVMAGDAVDRAGLVAGLIRSGTDVSSFVDKLARADFNTAHLPPDMRRAKQMGRENP